MRSWICIPLTVGIDERAEATINALFSPRLWTENGLLTQAGSDTFWDRSTLYALRGVYAVGETEKRQSIYIVIPLPGCWESMCLMPLKHGLKVVSVIFLRKVAYMDV